MRLDGNQAGASPSGGPEKRGAFSALREWWQKQDPKVQRKAVLYGVMLLLLLVLLGGYAAWKKPSEVQAPKPAEAKKKVLKFEFSEFEKGLYASTQRELAAMKEQIEKLKSELERAKQEAEVRPAPASSPPAPSELPPEPLPGPAEGPAADPPCAEGVCGVPPPPAVPAGPPEAAAERSRPSYQVIGDVAVVKGRQEAAEPQGEKKTESAVKVYLPPSFMEATLLSGIYAPAASEGQKNPLPVLLRIHDLAVLPNQVKANLKGCFVIGEATGNLADERAHVRLVTLSCVAKNGQAVIDQRVKGFVVDEDGKVGLRGQVVSRMGAAVARAALAGLFGGIGEGIGWSGFTVYTTPEGGAILSRTDFENMARAGIGRGIQQAAQELQKFYLELARQAIPVIEVGATKKVTVVISEGVELEIRNQKIFSGREEG